MTVFSCFAGLGVAVDACGPLGPLCHNSPAVVSRQPVPLQDAVLAGEAVWQLVAHLIHSLHACQGSNRCVCVGGGSPRKVCYWYCALSKQQC